MITAKRVSVFRKEHFNAAHRLNNPNWSDEKNERVYGKCNNFNFHGHNYDLIVQVTGEMNPETEEQDNLSKCSVLPGKASCPGDRWGHKR